MQIPKNETTVYEQYEHEHIETPGWRVVEYDELFAQLENTLLTDEMLELEDMSDEAYLLRHQKLEMEEKLKLGEKMKRYSNNNTLISVGSGVEEGDTSEEIKNTPTGDTESESDNSDKTNSKGEDEDVSVAIVEPWPPRKFPLSAEEYQQMLDEMQECYRVFP